MQNRTDEIRKQNSTVPSTPTSPLPASAGNPTTPLQRLQTNSLAGRMILPLRLFLGITFAYAGIQKLTDPQYFNPAASGYIGKQIAGFASGSPISGFLLNVAEPHARFFGALVAYGELAIGIGVLLGLLLRPAAFCGILLNALFFLSSTWRVHPYFYGSDIVFIFCWITLLLAGPLNSGLPALDALLMPHLLALMSPRQQVKLAPILHSLLGVGKIPTRADDAIPSTAPIRPTNEAALLPLRGQPGRTEREFPANKRTTYRGQKAREDARRRSQESRRNFLWGLVSGGAGVLALVWLGESLHLLPQTATNNPTAPTVNGTTPSDTGTPGSATSTPTTGTSSVIAQVSDVPTNSSLSFTIASNGDPGILIHLKNGQFVAYDATCTHAGCAVDYDPGTTRLVCPCHGAEFDPSNAGAVIDGPTSTPLASVTIHVDSATGAISM